MHAPIRSNIYRRRDIRRRQQLSVPINYGTEKRETKEYSIAYPIDRTCVSMHFTKLHLIELCKDETIFET